MRFNGKVVLITGAAGDIGRETARQFAQEGAKLVLVDVNNSRMDQLVLELGLKEDDYILIEADVTEENQVKRYVQEAVKKYGRIDVFFNNAGIEGNFSMIVDTPVENLDRVLSVNVRGVFLGLKHVLPLMMSQKSGSVIISGSIASFIGSPGMASYIASKHAVIGLTKNAALECVDYGVRVNAICPGGVNSRMMSSIEAGANPLNPAEVHDAFVQTIPMKRFAQVAEIAKLVMFLASDDSAYITGTASRIDGGAAAQ